MGKPSRATKKFNVDAHKKQRKLVKQHKSRDAITQKSMKNFKPEESSDEEDFQLEETKPIKNTKIDNNDQSDDSDEEMEDVNEVEGGEEQEDYNEDEIEQDSGSDIEFDKSESDKVNAKKLDKKEKVSDSDKVKSLKSEISGHKADLKKLQEKDPELFKFLSENDKGLVDFDVDEDDLDSDDSDDDSDQDNMEEDEPTKQEVLTSALLESWLEACQKNCTPQTLKKLIVAFKIACNNAEDMTKSASKDPYKISDSNMFNTILVVCLQNVPKFFDKIIQYDSEQQLSEDISTKPELPLSCKQYKTISLLVRSYIKCLISLMRSIGDPKMLLVILKGVEKAICYTVTQDKRELFGCLKTLLGHWSSSDEAVRIVSFLCIRKMAIFAPFPFIDNCLKGIYLNFVKNGKFMNNQNLPLVNFMCNCVVEIFGIDFASSYKQAFIFIRQLAIHLRNTLNNKTKESFQNIYNWQFINSIRAWVELVSAYPNQKYLSLLIYPLTQILIGVINLTPSTKYIPLRFHCVSLLNKLSESNQIFINTVPYIIEILNAQEFKKPFKSGGRLINFATTLSITSSNMKSREFQDGCKVHFLELLVENLTTHSYSIGFPELATPLLIHLDKYVRETQKHPTKLTNEISELTQVIRKQSRAIEEQRNNVKFSPKDTKQVQQFSEKQKQQQKSNPLFILLTKYRKQSLSTQKTIIESQKVYNYEDDEEEEEQDDDEEDEDSEGEEEEEEEEETFKDDGEEEKSRQVKKSKLQPTKKQPQQIKKQVTQHNTNNSNEDIVEDLILSD